MTSEAVCVSPVYLPPLFLSTKQPMRTSRVSNATTHIIATNHSWDAMSSLLGTERTRERLILKKCYSCCQLENTVSFCLFGLEEMSNGVFKYGSYAKF